MTDGMDENTIETASREAVDALKDFVPEQPDMVTYWQERARDAEAACKMANARIEELEGDVEELKKQNIKWVGRAHKLSLIYTKGDYWQIKQWEEEDL